MKRTVPLLITAIVGLVLIASRFIPAAESWGEVAAIWFDILAGVAFVLGGGSLFKLQLKKISDRAAGWGYAAVTLISFLVMLFAGLTKVGSQPAAQQEFYGQSFAHLAVAHLPDSTVVQVAAAIPPRADGEELPLSVKRQLSEQAGQIVFRGWMTPRQQSELSEYKDSLSWQCTIEKLFDLSQPKLPIKGKVEYLADHSALSVRGFMSDEVHQALLGLKGNERWNKAVEMLYEAGRRKVTVSVPQLPTGYQIPASMREFVSYDDHVRELSIRGPMSTSIRETLARANFPQVHPMSAEARTKYLHEFESADLKSKQSSYVHGYDWDMLPSAAAPLNQKQIATFDTVLAKTWVVDKLRVSLDAAGKAVEIEKTACEREQERKAAEGNTTAAQTAKPKKSGPDQVLNQRQRSEIDRFAADPKMTVESLADRLRAAGPFNERQNAALQEFFDKIPTTAEQELDLCVKLLRDGPLSQRQYHFLIDDYREQSRWRNVVGQLFVKADPTKYPWSGPYNSPGSIFGWFYEFAFKPLQATMFSLLAFYVASAAFRAFRAKNLQAVLLLVTAFIILLGQTFAGYWLTSWIPDSSPFAFLKIKGLTEFVAVFLTAGSRAIMIGIALGVASTSLKMLLGIDRSYLGTGD